MNLNKLLCKYLDNDGRGYVTVGNLVTVVCALPTILLIGMCYVRGATLLIGGTYYDLGLFGIPILAAGVIDVICICIALVLSAAVFTVVSAYIIGLIWITVWTVWDAEIATCERKWDEQHE